MSSRDNIGRPRPQRSPYQSMHEFLVLSIKLPVSSPFFNTHSYIYDFQYSMSLMLV